MNLLRDTGQLTESGLRRTPDGGLNASWALSWPEQQAAGIEPIVLQAYFGGGFHHPHLRGTTVHDWPLNVERRGCGGPAIHTPGDRVERSAQSRLPFRLSDRSSCDGESRQSTRRRSQSNVIPAIVNLRSDCTDFATYAGLYSLSDWYKISVSSMAAIAPSTWPPTTSP